MKCNDVFKKLPLYAGGDLSGREREAVRKHVETCARCAAGLRELRASLDAVRGLAAPDAPDADFYDRIESRLDGEDAPIEEPVRRLVNAAWLRPAVALAAAAVMLFAALSVFRPFFDRATPAAVKASAAALAERPSFVVWNETPELTRYFHAPVKYEDWEPREGTPGIFMIMHKPDPENDPGRFVVDYVGQSTSYALKGFPWFYHRKRRVLELSGSEENVYVTVCYLPESHFMARRSARIALDRKLNPTLDD